MSTLHVPTVQVVRSATHLEIELLKRPAPNIEFDNDAAERAYGERDYGLASQLQAIAVAACGMRNPDELVFTNWDWNPSDSRTITLDRSILSCDLVNAMLDTLTGAYASWRIYLTVSQNLAKDGEELGSACLFADAAIIERSLGTCLGLPA